MSTLKPLWPDYTYETKSSPKSAAERIEGITFGAWDLLHAGHVTFLKSCKAECDLLFVGLHVNPSTERGFKNKPAQSVFERYIQLAACKYVDEIVPYETEEDILNFLSCADFDIRFLGKEYENKDFTGKQFCIDNKIDLCYFPRDHNYSTSELRDRIKNT